MKNSHFINIAKKIKRCFKIESAIHTESAMYIIVQTIEMQLNNIFSISNITHVKVQDKNEDKYCTVLHTLKLSLHSKVTIKYNGQQRPNKLDINRILLLCPMSN